MSQKLPLAAQVVLITGASSGMSAVVGQQLAQQFDRRRQHDAIEIRFVMAARHPIALEKVIQNCQRARKRGDWGKEEDEGVGEMREIEKLMNYE